MLRKAKGGVWCSLPTILLFPLSKIDAMLRQNHSGGACHPKHPHIHVVLCTQHLQTHSQCCQHACQVHRQRYKEKLMPLGYPNRGPLDGQGSPVCLAEATLPQRTDSENIGFSAICAYTLRSCLSGVGVQGQSAAPGHHDRSRWMVRAAGINLVH